jgi:hypothetical protein
VEIETLTRKEAKERGLKTYFAKNPCGKGHWPCERYTTNRHCVSCSSEYSKTDDVKSSCSQRRILNKDVRSTYGKEYYLKNKYNIQPKNRLYHVTHRERGRILSIEYNKANKETCNANSAWRRASQRQQTPTWANRKAIAEFYKLARKLTEETGVPHHVDHIIPLLGENVSGLHVENNLRVITAYENLSKSNKLIEDLIV